MQRLSALPAGEAAELPGLLSTIPTPATRRDDPVRSLRIFRVDGTAVLAPEPGDSPGDSTPWITRTRFGDLHQTVRVWTDREWRMTPHADRPLDAVRLANDCWVHLA